jgi:hypothetical protein
MITGWRQGKGLGVLSVICGILSITAYPFAVFAGVFLAEPRDQVSQVLVCCAIAFLMAILAVVFGHIGRSRYGRASGKSDGSRGGAAGLVTGYLALVLGAFLSPALARAAERAQGMWCNNFLKQISTTVYTTMVDGGTNGDAVRALFRPDRDTNLAHGFSSLDADGFDHDSWRRLRLLSNWLDTPYCLVCPADKTKTPAPNWESFGPSNVTYLIHVTTNDLDVYPLTELVICPIHGHAALADGSVQSREKAMR